MGDNECPVGITWKVALSHVTIFFHIISPLNKATQFHAGGVLMDAAWNSAAVETVSVLKGLAYGNVGGLVDTN